MRRNLFLACALILAMWTSAGIAHAGSGSFEDPEDDTFDTSTQSEGPGLLDIVAGSFEDTAETITYDLTMQDGFTADDVGFIHWYLDFPGHQECPEGLVEIEGEGGELTGRVGKCRPTGGDDTVGPLRDVVHEDGSRTITVIFERSVLEQAGMTEDQYDLSVYAKGSDDRGDGTDPVQHRLSPRPTPDVPPTPEITATPEPTPDATPTPGPTVDPTPAAASNEGSPDPTPTATPSPTPGRDPDASYAAPEERRAGPGPARTAATGGAVAGAGGSLFALYYFRPW